MRSAKKIPGFMPKIAFSTAPGSAPKPSNPRAFIALAAFVSLAGLGALSACASAGPSGNSNVPAPAKAVNLDRYLGRWYELARYENRFEKNCEGVTAEYSRRQDGMINVLNSCRKGDVGGPLTQAKGRAKIVADSQNAKLKVSFFGPFFGDYWVLDRADDYAWSIVGEPTGRYLWILARDPNPSPETLAMLKERAASLGYDLRLLRETKQPPA